VSGPELKRSNKAGVLVIGAVEDTSNNLKLFTDTELKALRRKVPKLIV